MEQNRELRNKLKSLWSIIIWQRGRSIKWSKNSLFNKWSREIWTATCKKMKLNHQLTPYTKINSRWIRDLNISCDTMKILQENIGRKVSDISQSNIFTDMSPRARDIKERINKWDLTKIKASAWLKKTALKWKENQLYGKTYLPMIPQTRVWSPKYIKNSHNSIPGRQKNPIKKVGKRLQQILLWGGHTEGSETYEKMLSITSHQRDAN